MIIFNKTIRNYLLKTQVKGYVEQAKVGSKLETLGLIADLMKRKEAAVKQWGPDSKPAKQLQNSIKQLEKYAEQAD